MAGWITPGARSARRDAAIRILAVAGKMIGEADTDAAWAELFRGLEGAS